jgi:hypothetical protein
MAASRTGCRGQVPSQQWRQAGADQLDGRHLEEGLRESLGLMVNYLYEPGAIEANHQKFVQGSIVASRRVRGLALGD